jgi:hemerythrin
MNVPRLLDQQHAELRAMLREVRASTAERRAVAFEMLNDAIVHHWAVEERHLYPILEQRGYRDLYSSLELHRSLCHISQDLRRLCDDGPHFFSALKVLAAHIEQHIVDEERTVLPFVEQALDAGEQRAIGERMQETIAEMENEDWLGTPEAWRNASSA